MANYENLKTAIQQVIYENGNQEITGSVMQATLLAMVNSLGANYQYAGIATPSTNPGTPDQNVFYLAATAGTYVNFGNIVLGENEVAILKYNGSWTKETSGFASAKKVNQLDQMMGVLLSASDKTADISLVQTSAALNSGGSIFSAPASYTVQSISVSDLEYDYLFFTLQYTGQNFAIAAAYDSNGVFIKNYGMATAGGSPKVAVIKKDSNIATLKFTIQPQYSHELMAVKEGTVLDVISQRIGDVENEQKMILEKENVVPSLSLVQDGATLAPGGSIVSSQYTTGYKVMSLDVEGKGYVFFVLNNSYAGSGWSFACGYDADGNFVESYGVAAAGGSPVSLTFAPSPNVSTLKMTIYKNGSFGLVAYSYGVALEILNSGAGTIKTNTIYIAPTDTGDNSLVGVLKSLSADTSGSAPGKYNRYEIILQPGNYDMDCSDQLTALPRGVFVPPYTTIKGAGRGVTFLKYIYEGTNDTVMSEHSVLNMPYTSSLEDVSVIAENIRYTIHSDLPETGKSADNSVVELRNVELIHNGITNGETPTINNPSAWGGGTLSGQVRRFYNCKFVAAMYTPFANHDRNTNIAAQYFEFQNCEFEALRVNSSDLVTDYATPAVLLNSWGSGVPVFVNFVNCYANKWVGLFTTGNFDSDYQVKCDNELLFHIKENTANPQNKRHYITGGCREFVFTNSTTKGTPVVMVDSRSARAAIATDAPALIVGVLVHDVSAGDVGVVMFSGLFAVQQIIGNSFSAGDLIGWNGSSWVADSNNPIAVLLTNGIAKVI